MKVTVTGRNVDVTPALRKYAEDKVGKFDKYLSNITEATVTFSIQKHLQKVDVLIRANGTILQAEGITEELYASIDEATSKLDKQVRKHKDKITSRRKGAQRASEAQATGEAAAESSESVIIERQSYEMKPMPPEEAVMQLEIDGMDFLVFTNSENGQIGVVYKRKDGNFGLIEPVAQ